MFDGEGFVRGVLRKGRRLEGASALVVGSGGVGSAIAASLAKAGVARLAVFDATRPAMESLAGRLRAAYPALGSRPARTTRPASTSWSTRRRSA